MDSNTQLFLTERSAPRAALAGVVWIDTHCLTASIFRFAHQDSGELIPRHISNALGKVMVFEHPINVEVLNCNKPEAVDQPVVDQAGLDPTYCGVKVVFSSL